jgi:hypothetical protein
VGGLLGLPVRCVRILWITGRLAGFLLVGGLHS